MERRDELSSPSHEPARERVNPTPDEPGRDPEGTAPQIAGGVAGAGAGAAMGMIAGPVGMVIGALAGAVGGWWATEKFTEGTGGFTDEEDRWYRQHYQTPEFLLADRPYEEVRPAYTYGHLAAHNPAYRGRRFAEIEHELARDWQRSLGTRHGEWNAARRYARVGYDRRAQRGDVEETLPPGIAL